MVERLWPWLLALASGVLVALCFPPFDFTVLVWVALMPVTAGVWFTERPDGTQRFGPLKGLLLGWLMGLAYFGITFSWIHHVTWLGMGLFVCYLAIYPALWTSFLCLACRPGTTVFDLYLPLPRGDLLTEADGGLWTNSLRNVRLGVFAGLAWAGLEWLRGWLFTGFGWNGLGVAMHDNPALMQFSAITGVPGLSFLVVFVNVVGLAVLRRLVQEIGRMGRKPHFDFILMILVIALVFLYGMRRMDRQPGETQELQVAVVQPNIPLELYWTPEAHDYILDELERLTLLAAATDPDVIIWPESATHHAVLGYYTHRASYDLVKRLLDTGDFNFLLGTTYDEPVEELEEDEPADKVEAVLSFNAALLLKRDRQGVQIYRKIHLVPFGEFVPFRNSFPLLAWIVGDRVPADFRSGGEFTLLETQDPEVLIAPLICFEDTVPRLARQFVRGGGEMFVNMTNDGWFKESAAARQHLINAQFRAAENARPMVRAANTGVSAFISDRGVIVDIVADETGNTFVDQTRARKVFVEKNPEITFYTRFGDVFGIGAFAFFLVVTIAGIGVRAKKPADEVV